MKEKPSSPSFAARPRGDLNEWISTLSPAKRALLELKLAQKGSGVSNRRVIPRRTEPDPAPLSFAQERLWFLDQLEPGTPAYNVPEAVLLRGSLDVTALERSLGEILKRHEALRTTFVSVKGRPVQRIAPAALELSLPVVNLEVLSAAEQQEEVRRLAIEEAQRPFELERGPLLRAKLPRLGDEEHVLLLVMHHIVSDGWSMGVFWRELDALYEAFSKGKPLPLAELPIQYADFAVWQRRWLAGEVLDEQLSYWKRQLADVPVLELPTDRPRPPVQTYRGTSQELVLPSSLTEALKELSRREETTLFMVLLAAFQVLLSRYSGQEDIVVGSPIANRNRAEIEGLIGFFANTLVLRTDLSGDPTFKELLGRVREVALEAYDHQDVPFEKLIEELKPKRDLSRTPLFQVMFALQDAPRQALKLPGLTLSWLDIDNGTAKFDLTVSVTEGQEGLTGWLEYNTDLFEEATITRMVEHFRTLLEGIVADPERRISELPLLTEAEHHQLLIEWNDTQTDYPREACIHQLFEEQAERTPDAVAVGFDDQQLTYRELNRRANQLAHRLRKLGVGPEVPVGICVERSVEMVVGLLGILKAGGAYVPLDPTYPKERISFVLRDTRVPVLLTQEQLVEGLPEHGAQIVCLDADYWPAIARGEREENPISGATANNLAYMIYTSGSTGTPKGVMLTHGGLLNLVFWHRRAFGVSRADRATQVANPTFDASVWELWPYLAVGARVHFPNEETRTSPTRLRDWLLSESITISFLPTVLAESILSLEWPKESVLRVMLTGGEKIHQYPLDSTPFALVNNYGPTETTVVATSGVVRPTKAGKQTEATPAIGRPITNTQIYLLDKHLQRVPIGVLGELYIGGEGLARGYLNRPDLTAERFIPDPFSDEPGARLYRTGDLARYLPDGNIEFLGRIDQQVKLRGFRIELGEIESVLGQHPAVAETVVALREDKPDDKRLVAYIIPTAYQQQEPTTSELRAYLKERLPEHMVPSAFVRLDALPLTANGKVDRRALPAPEGLRSELESAFVAPRDELEERLAGIWEAVLGIERVGIHDDFFELGGHSLLAARLAAMLSAALAADVSVKLLVTHPTVEALADAIEQLQRADEEPSATCAAPPTASPAPPPARSGDDSTSRTLRIELRPLLSLFAAGRLAPVDAAALTYLADDLPARAGCSRDEIRALWYDDLPTVTAVLETFLGRIAIITLPRFASELYENQDDLVRLAMEALATAGRLGARAVSLTGLIPSATDYGRAIAASISKTELPSITTGHASTAATVVLMTERLLQAAGRSLTDAHVGVLGWGSIGRTSLRLLLHALAHPAAITVCDVYGIRDRADDIRQELVDLVGYQGPVRVVESRGKVPAEFYESTVMLGATNVANVLDISRMRPGTVIVDDSGPHCFSVPAAVRRLREAEDILFTEGGVLQSPHPIEWVRYLPRIAEQTASAAYLKSIARHDPHRITGCVLAGLLCARFPDLGPTVGHADDDSCAKHYERLRQLGFAAADPHCGEHVLAPEAILGFRRRFSVVPFLQSALMRAHDGA